MLVPSFNFSSSTISDGTDALHPATLRGLGPDQTLVLVNGKRRHKSALLHVNSSVLRGTAGTDFNAIPSAAIERIEVLRDGAAAQYDSDAIAGVINIVLIPKETALLANYPNPFNPETWIPYQLSKRSDVTLTIYAVNGQVVRRLILGHQPAGMYQSRARAAYWDGRNAFDEPVASGIYFYTLTAGDFTATRKMLIQTISSCLNR